MSAVTVLPTVTLTLLDRCDASAIGSCAAEVAVWMTEDSAPMLFCNHHWHVNEDAVRALNPFHVQVASDVE